MDQLQRLLDVREALLLRHPQLAPLILPLEWKEERDLPFGSIIGTDGKQFIYDPEGIAEQDDLHLAAKVTHESIHNGMLHTLESRRTALIGSDPTMKQMIRYNNAIDYVTNCIVNAMDLPVEDGLYDPQYEGMFVEEVYHKLVEDGGPTPHPGTCYVKFQKGDEKDTAEHTTQMQQAFADFIVLSKMMGTLPGSMLDKLAETLKPEIDWLELLMDLVTVMCGKEDFTWRRPSRRSLALDIYLPSGLDSSVECLCFGSDTSRSMSVEDFGKSVGGVILAAETVKIRKFWWVEFDAEVQRVLEFEGSFEPPTDMKGRGGTDFRPFFEEAVKHDPVCIICFTDLEGTFPDRPPDKPVIWVTRNPTGTVPWGELVRIK